MRLPGPIARFILRARMRLAMRACSGQARRDDRLPAAENQIGMAGKHRTGDLGQLLRVEAGVSVTDAHDVRGSSLEPGRDGSSEAALRNVDDECPERARNGGAVVGGSVVGDDRPVTGGHSRQHPRKRGSLVQAWEHDVDDDASPRPPLLGSAVTVRPWHTRSTMHNLRSLRLGAAFGAGLGLAGECDCRMRLQRSCAADPVANGRRTGEGAAAGRDARWQRSSRR